MRTNFDSLGVVGQKVFYSGTDGGGDFYGLQFGD